VSGHEALSRAVNEPQKLPSSRAARIAVLRKTGRRTKNHPVASAGPMSADLGCWAGSPARGSRGERLGGVLVRSERGHRPSSSATRHCPGFVPRKLSGRGLSGGARGSPGKPGAGNPRAVGAGASDRNEAWCPGGGRSRSGGAESSARAGGSREVIGVTRPAEAWRFGGDGSRGSQLPVGARQGGRGAFGDDGRRKEVPALVPATQPAMGPGDAKQAGRRSARGGPRSTRKTRAPPRTVRCNQRHRHHDRTPRSFRRRPRLGAC